MYLRLISRSILLILTAFLILTLPACGGSDKSGAPLTEKQIEAKLPDRVKAADLSLQKLKAAIDQGQIRNALILAEYARILKGQKPELSTLIDNLAKDATSNGALMNSLVNRLDSLKNNPELFESSMARMQEANAIVNAAKADDYNYALTDVVNVLADMSDGSLPRVEAPAKQQSLSTNQAQDMGTGSQLIGNPAYGQWTNHGGTSIWEWYGMYAMFRDLTGGRSYNYGYWDRNRDWSYYSDIGRNRYGDTRTRDKYAPKSKKYSTARDYGVNRKSYGSASTERRASTYSSGSQKTTNSTFAKQQAGSVPGSFRNRSTYSRSSFGGK